MLETWLRSLGWEDLLEEGMETHSNILAWRIPWTEEPCMLQSRGRKESDTTEPRARTHASDIQEQIGVRKYMLDLLFA